MPAHERAITQQELIEHSGRLARRLTSHLDALDSDDDDFLDDIAGITRAAFGHGRGDDVIFRLCRSNHLEFPKLSVALAPENDKTTVFSVGNIPADPPGNGATDHRDVNSREWQDVAAVISKDNRSRRLTTWAQLLTDYGNTYGAHLSATIPHVLTEASLYGAPGGTLGAYMLRAAAVAAERCFAQILPELGYKGPLRGDRPYSAHAGHFGWLAVHDGNDQRGFRFDWALAEPGEHTLMQVPFEGALWTVRSVPVPGTDGYVLQTEVTNY